MSRLRFGAPLFGLTLVIGSAAGTSAQSLTDFAAKAPIELDGAGPYYQLALPFAAHLDAHFPDLRDLRVFDGEGAAVPFTIIRAAPPAEQTSPDIPVAWFPLYASDSAPDAVPDVHVERRANGTVVSVTGRNGRDEGPRQPRGYLLDLSQNKNPARRLVLDWDPAVTGFQQVTVEASEDLEHWQTWRDAAQLARLEFNGQQIERRDIDLNDRRAAYLRLTWREPREAPRLTAVTLTTATTRPAPFAWSEALTPSRTGEGVYEWRLPERIAPQRVKIALPHVNTLAPAELWGRDDSQPRAQRTLLAGTVLYRLAAQGREWEQDDIAVSGPPVNAIELRVDSRGGGLGGAPTLTLGLTARQVLFLARGSGPFILAIGNSQAKPAELAAATLIPGYGTAGAPPVSPAKLGPFAGSVAQQGAPADALPFMLTWKTLTLWAVLLTGIAAIAAMAFFLLRQTRQ